jgi:hypothetical protein
MSESAALNVIGKPYDAVAVMIGNAFDYATKGSMRDFPTRVSEWIDAHASDRRYRLQWNAATSDFSSAIITYRGRRLYVYGRWDAASRDRTYYVRVAGVAGVIR